MEVCNPEYLLFPFPSIKKSLVLTKGSVVVIHSKLHQAIISTCETMMAASHQGNHKTRSKTHTVWTFNMRNLLLFIETVYNNGKSILSTLTSSVRANSTMFVEGVKKTNKYKEATYSFDQLIIH